MFGLKKFDVDVFTIMIRGSIDLLRVIFRFKWRIESNDGSTF